MEKKVLLLIVVLLMLFTFTASASIISTSVDTRAKIEYWQDDGFVNYAETNNSGTLSSSSLVEDIDTGAKVSSDLSISGLTEESASFNFEVQLKSPESSPTSYVPAEEREFYRLTASNETGFLINYYAEDNSVLNVNWDFSYSGINPFGLQIIRLSPENDRWNPWLTTGDVGYLGQYIGEQSFNLLAGELYSLDLFLYPNYQGYIYKDSFLTGSFSLDFNYDSGSPVPEPSTLLLLGSGFATLAFYARKRKK